VSLKTVDESATGDVKVTVNVPALCAIAIPEEPVPSLKVPPSFQTTAFVEDELKIASGELLELLNALIVKSSP
jgi:hypothetical protein